MLINNLLNITFPIAALYFLYLTIKDTMPMNSNKKGAMNKYISMLCILFIAAIFISNMKNSTNFGTGFNAGEKYGELTGIVFRKMILAIFYLNIFSLGVKKIIDKTSKISLVV